MSTTSFRFTIGDRCRGSVFPISAHYVGLHLDWMGGPRIAVNVKVDNALGMADALKEAVVLAKSMSLSGEKQQGADPVCDCQCPEPATGVALISMDCPIHNLHPAGTIEA